MDRSVEWARVSDRAAVTELHGRLYDLECFRSRGGLRGGDATVRNGTGQTETGGLGTPRLAVRMQAATSNCELTITLGRSKDAAEAAMNQKLWMLLRMHEPSLRNWAVPIR